MATASRPVLQPYLPRLILDWQANTPELLWRELEGSMVFVDVSGFTKMSERLARQGKVGAEEVSDVIGETFATLLAEAYMAGGSLLKFGGDALLLFFDGHGHAMRAAAAAHGMRRELRRVGRFTTTAGQVTLRMSVGAHTGRYHFFLVGGSHRELLVAGPASTETVTMEGAASAGQILLSPALAAEMLPSNRGTALGPGFLLRGTPPGISSIPVSREATTLDLEPFVPTGLREILLAGDVEPEHRSVTIAFVHFGHFDHVVEHDGLDAAAEALDRLVRAAQDACEATGVTFLATDIAPDGGKLILTAGAPVVTGADEEQMLLAVRAIVDADCGLPLHVGVNKGPVFAGTIGPSYRRTYTVMGDAVNLSARLMAKAEIGEIIATPVVLDASRTIFATRELEPFLVKGKKKPITAFAVGEAQGSRTTIAEAGLPLLGRDEELGALLDAWEAAQRGEGRVVEIVAEPGMGKSRLLDEFLARIGDARVIHGECRLYQSATPYFPFRALLRAAFGFDGLGREKAVAALERLVEERSPSLAPWLSLIATPLDLDVPASPEVEALDDKFRRARLEEAVAALVAEVAGEPAVVVVEDTHWMDEPSRDLLTRVTTTLGASPWVVVLTRRPGDEGYVAPGEAVVRIELQPLGPEPVIALIHAATEDAPLRPQQERELAERAAGNPLFLIELLDALKRGEDVENMPSSVEGLIHARIDRLPTVEKRQLRALSVMGVGFRVEHATATLGVETADEVRRVLRPLGEFVSIDRTGWVEFRHALIRDAAYEGLPYRRRLELHAMVGDSIFAAATAPEEQAQLLSVHYWYARRWDEAWRFSCVAGDQARDVYANNEAARFYEWATRAGTHVAAVDDGAMARVWRELGLVREKAGNYESAFDAFRRASGMLGDPVARAAIYEERARVRYRAGSPLRAVRETATGLRLIDGIRSTDAHRARAALLARRAFDVFALGRAREALTLAQRAAAEAESVDERRALAVAYAVLDPIYAQVGEPEKAVFGARAVEIYRELGMQVAAGIAEMNLGVRAYANGDWDEALERYSRAREELYRLGDDASSGFAGANLGELLVSRGMLDEAHDVLRSAQRSLRSAGLLEGVIFADLQISRIQAERGEFELAIAICVGATEEARTRGMGDLVVEASIHLADAYLRSGNAAKALGVLDASAEAVRDEDLAYLRVPLGRVRGRALMEMGRFVEAADAFEQALAEARAQQLPYEEVLILGARADLADRTDGQRNDEELLEAKRLQQLLGLRALAGAT